MATSQTSPDLARAYTDQGGTSIWGPGPYLKVPNRIAGDDEWEPIDRVFCPWGYPPDRIRVAWSAVYLQLRTVELARVGPSSWEWVLHVSPWIPNANCNVCSKDVAFRKVERGKFVAV